ncbi:family 78 glycoside hydrolase catalytic domain [Mucilaginibacter sp. KACC 22773]|uniref:family 78 glycoside hydrolase catalytic domain n=1 Tax=Mucilaginibacter sp. KACC 22773 TaxID=3025671 RepID=UPI002365057B|nr:family 78 glycoside hydrolase catalytic domain [Mucilaginibacter sp. KACC 22773]WDF80291.1 family 78 glycoside hydrolase catalytic domain [Mucilaginibacter sp. KACC 22773]
MLKKIILFLLLVLPLGLFAQDLKVAGLQCDYKQNPQGIESVSPGLSWQMKSSRASTMQTAYRVLVSDDLQKLKSNSGNIWDSKKVNSPASLQVAYKGRQLQPAKTYYWKVMVWDNHYQQSAWSSTASWQMGLLTQTDWAGANWIAYDKLPDTSVIVPFYHGKGPKKLGIANDVLPLLRKMFNVGNQLKRATLYICGLGHFDLSLNGKKVGDHFLDPGWTKYDKQALYVPFDVTGQLKAGKNTIGVMLGNGFYYIPRDKRYRKLTGGYGYPKMICRLVMEYQDGRIDNLLSDTSWKTTPGPVIFSSIYGGEDYNANLEQAAWNTNSFNDENWRKAIQVDGPPMLNAQAADPLKVMQEFIPQNKTQLNTGAWIYDLGQNFSGIPQITVKGKKGDTVKIIPAELVNADGSANQKGSGGPHYYNYILKGDGAETWQPQFTYYGFRYLQVVGAAPQNETNAKQQPVIVAIKGLHTRNAAATVGDFACSNELFNKTFRLIDWAMKSNMASVFTDCPHREKLGWLEEAHLVGSSLHYNYDIVGLARKCINDMRISQTEDGLIPEIAPEYVKFDEPFRDSPEWGSNAVILPWYVYQWYGDKGVLAQNYDMIKRYLAYLNKKADGNILMQGLGDWYDLGPNPPGVSQLTPQGITATALYYYDLDIATKIATLLGKSEDAAAYNKLADQVKQSYNKKFFNAETKQYGTGSQAANAISVYTGLVEPQYKTAVVNNIVKDIRGRGNSLTAGDIGYRYLLRVLDDEGRSDVIFDMNSRADVPGYGYQLAHGATALTESWAALPSVSNNHFMLGHLMEWFYSGLAGIRPADDAIAFNKIEIRPEVVGDVTWAKANYQSPYGTISSSWEKEAGKFELSVSIPANTTAIIYLPAAKAAMITAGGQSIRNRKGMEFMGYKNGKALVKVGSGGYLFVVR